MGSEVSSSAKMQPMAQMSGKNKKLEKLFKNCLELTGIFQQTCQESEERLEILLEIFTANVISILLTHKTIFKTNQYISLYLL